MLFFFNDTATTEIYTLSLHDALPICDPRARRRQRPGPSEAAGGASRRAARSRRGAAGRRPVQLRSAPRPEGARSEEDTSELQSRLQLVCRLLLEKKKKSYKTDVYSRA